jgi:hypothetical protein
MEEEQNRRSLLSGLGVAEQATGTGPGLCSSLPSSSLSGSGSADPTTGVGSGLSTLKPDVSSPKSGSSSA